MSASKRLKIVRDSLVKSQKEMAALLNLSYRTYQNYEDGVNNPSWDACESLARLGYNANWLLTGEGEMKRPKVNGHVANGNNIIQGAHIDADKIHLQVHQVKEVQAPAYADPLDGRFLKDWHRLSEAGMMRVWTLLKEEIEREAGK